MYNEKSSTIGPFIKNWRSLIYEAKVLFNYNVLRVRNRPVGNIKDPKNFPIIIISYNQLHYLRLLINFLQKSEYRRIVIIDNASTYIPLLKYLDGIKRIVKVHKLKKNYGHMVFWQRKEFFKLYSKSYYVVTDPDVLPDEDCPEDFLFKFKKILEGDPNLTKVGFGLRLDNIPDFNPFKKQILNWEYRYWMKKYDEKNFRAEIDTTFALYRPKTFPVNKAFFQAVRTGTPYLASHGGWLIDPKNLTEEQKYYMSAANNSSSWRINEEGELYNQEYK